MSHDVPLRPHARIVRMANQIGTFFLSKPHQEGVAGVAEHINRFWEPRMRSQFFEMIEAGHAGFDTLVVEAATQVRPPPPAETVPG